MCTVDDSDVSQSYRRRLAELDRDKQLLDARDRRLSSWRGLSFVVLLGIGLYTLFVPRAIQWVAVGIVAAVFIVFVVLHAIVSTRQFDVERRSALMKRGLERLAGSYRAPPGQEHLRGDRYADAEHPYTGDLDVFGPASLYERLNVTETPGGAARLADWLRAPAEVTTIAARQKAARELARMDALREDMALAGMRAGKIDRDAAPFLRWAEESAAYARTGRVPTLVSLLLVAGSLAALWASASWGGMWTRIWLGIVGAQILLLMLLRARLEPVLAPICIKQSPLAHYRELLAAAEGANFEDDSLLALQKRLRDGEATASQHIDALDRLTGLAVVRHNAIVYILADIFLCWDVWIAFLIDRWRLRHGPSVARWLDTLSELEALVSLATFAREHADYAWPEVTAGAPCFEAAALGHPLIAPSERVCNDVSLTAEHSGLMITGSNMSGKSTMLRSIGVNAVLAQIGAPVCAASLRMSRLRVHTSMRVGDDLDRGASRFFMEVAKLKSVVDALDATRPGDPALCFLLDEVLHGTNSRERNIGAKAVVRYLIDGGAIGAVSSHDLGLVELEALTGGRVRNVHFEDHIEDGRMCFDYRMKPWPVSTSNALRLMRSVGIDFPGLTDSAEPAGAPR